MASFPTTLPSAPTEVSSYIRWWLGNLSVDIISDLDLTDIVTPVTTLYTDNVCKATYYSTIETLKWLIRQDDVESGSTGASGSITRQREKEGNVEYETEYQDVISSTRFGWDKILADLLEAPVSIGCDPFEGEVKELQGTVIIGGADVNGYEDSFRTRQRFGVAIQNNRYGYNSVFGRRLF